MHRQAARLARHRLSAARNATRDDPVRLRARPADDTDYEPLHERRVSGARAQPAVRRCELHPRVCLVSVARGGAPRRLAPTIGFLRARASSPKGKPLRLRVSARQRTLRLPDRSSGFLASTEAAWPGGETGQSSSSAPVSQSARSDTWSLPSRRRPRWKRCSARQRRRSVVRCPDRNRSLVGPLTTAYQPSSNVALTGVVGCSESVPGQRSVCPSEQLQPRDLEEGDAEGFHRRIRHEPRYRDRGEAQTLAERRYMNFARPNRQPDRAGDGLACAIGGGHERDRLGRPLLRRRGRPRPARARLPLRRRAHDG